MATRALFAIDEWYHCYNRGVEKRRVCMVKHDYERFQTLLYACNGSASVKISDRRKNSLADILSDVNLKRGEPLVEIGAYCLMPNHVHLLMKEIQPGGISIFMQKIFTGYTMYFNIKYRRTGALFAGVFKSRHIHNDEYLKTALPYILLNPCSLLDPRWKSGKANIASVQRELLRYPYSSAPDFFDEKRIENKLLTTDWSDYFDKKPSLTTMLKNAKEYNASLPRGFALEHALEQTL